VNCLPSPGRYLRRTDIVAPVEKRAMCNVYCLNPAYATVLRRLLFCAIFTRIVSPPILGLIEAAVSNEADSEASKQACIAGSREHAGGQASPRSAGIWKIRPKGRYGTHGGPPAATLGLRGESAFQNAPLIRMSRTLA
jgi:hypothetical protein